MSNLSALDPDAIGKYNYELWHNYLLGRNWSYGLYLWQSILMGNF